MFEILVYHYIFRSLLANKKDALNYISFSFSTNNTNTYMFITDAKRVLSIESYTHIIKLRRCKTSNPKGQPATPPHPLNFAICFPSGILISHAKPTLWYIKH